MTVDPKKPGGEKHGPDGALGRISDDASVRKPTGWVTVVLLILAILVVVALFRAWATAPRYRELLVTILVAFGLTGVYPLAYLAYLGFGADAKRKRLRVDFQLFGLVSEDALDETINKLYQNVYSWPQFTVYILLIIVVSALVLTGYLKREHLDFADPDIMELMFFGYLGAYVFSIQELIRRYNTFDLQPQVYSSILVRMLVAVAAVFIFASMVALGGGDLLRDESNATTETQAWTTIIAFVIGIFPSNGIRWLVRQANRVLNPPINQDSELPLRNLLGISTWHEARLSMMGIDDAQNLATADIPKLLLTTQFDTQQVANWIDQAILYVKVGQKISRFREAKITTFHEFQGAMDSLPFDSGSDSRSNLATILGLTDPGELKRIRDYSNYPNYTHIALYYEGTARVGSQRAEISVQKLTGAGVLDRTWTKTLTNPDQIKDLQGEARKLKRRLHGAPKDPELHTKLGVVAYLLHQLDEAEAYFNRALELDSELAQAYYGRSIVYLDHGDYQKAIGDATRATTLNPSYAEAFDQLGRVNHTMGYQDMAIKHLDKALQMDPRLAVAYYNRGVIYTAKGRFAEAIEEFEKAYLLGYEQTGLWTAWGIALISTRDYHTAIDKLSQAIIQNPELADAYANRGNAYLELGEGFFEQTRNDLKTALEKDASLYETHNNLGSLEFKLGNYEQAIVHFKAALDRNKDYFGARFNLAIAQYNLRRLEQATLQFQKLNAMVSTDSADENQKQQVEYLAGLLGLSSKTLEEMMETLELYRNMGDKNGVALSLRQMGALHRQRGELALAQEYLTEAAEVYDAMGQTDKAQAAKEELAQVQDLSSEQNQS